MLKVQECETQLSLRFRGEMTPTEDAKRQGNVFWRRALNATPPPTLLLFLELFDSVTLYGHINSLLKYPSSITKLLDNAVLITVKDLCRGFPFQHLNFSLPTDACPLKHRGYKFIRALAEHITFNEKGNNASVYLKLRGKAPP